METILNLGALESRALGSALKLFGPDGESSALWCPPALLIKGERRHPLSVSRMGVLVFGSVSSPMALYRDWDHIALDLAMQSVADHVAGVCAKTLGQSDTRGWTIGNQAQEWCLMSHHGTRAYNWDETGQPYHSFGTVQLPFIEVHQVKTPAGFLVQLALALADRL